ncbi:MAG: acyl-CoA dehydrogenase family protein [Gordonia sp. (in: high G+C Gram-positive bacteria)]|uniref:acyl-CoA dehydrogenase family protein n=1 Tax=Gordonia sp. (in: high G+C Gram-positive bacteria) TaxID=84139 RepID=UPI003BB64256
MSNELDALADAVRDACRRGGGNAAVRTAITAPERYDDALWRTLATQVGVAALLIPEASGGVGATVLEGAAVAEVLGETLAPVPFFSSAVLATATLLAANDEAASARLLSDLAEGTRTAAVCWAGPAGWESPGVTADAGLLSGAAEYVIDGESADTFLVLAGPGRVTLHEIAADAPGVTVTPLPVLDPTRPLCRVEFHQAAAEVIESGRDLAEQLRTLAWAVLSAEQTGGAARALELTVEHTTARHQFGRALASFQALKHTMADMYTLVETMRSISAAAVQAVADGAANAGELAAAAHVYCSEGYIKVTGDAIQLHGGIGITSEHDIGLYFKRAQADAQLFGPPQGAVAQIPV